MKIRDIIKTSVITLTKEATVLEAAQIMREQHVGSIIIVDQTKDQSKPIGIVTDRDIVVQLIAKQVPLESIEVQDIMASNLILSNEEEDVYSVIRKMRTHGVKRIPVINGEGYLKGIVSFEDLFLELSRELTDLARLYLKTKDNEKTLRT